MFTRTFLTFQRLFRISWFWECRNYLLKQCINIYSGFCRHFNIHCLHLGCLFLTFFGCHISTIKPLDKNNRISTRSILFPTSKTRQSQCWLATSAYHWATLLNDSRSTIQQWVHSHLLRQRRLPLHWSLEYMTESNSESVYRWIFHRWHGLLTCRIP